MEKSSDGKDRLERFVRDNREAFDSFELDDTSWDRIEARLQFKPIHTGTATDGADPSASDTPPPGKRILPLWSRSYFDWRMAAGIVIALGLSWFYFLNKEYGVTRDPKVALTMPFYAREFTQYSQTINKKRSELIRLTSENPVLFKEFSDDLERLQKSYQSLRSDLSQSPDRDAIVQAMIENLRWQVDLLNTQLLILQQVKTTDDHEKADPAVNI